MSEKNNHIDQLKALYEAKLAAKDELIAMLAHDIRSPLSVIEISAQRLLKESQITPNQKVFIKKILTNSLNARDLVSDILDLGKGFKLIYKKVVLKDYLEEIVDAMEPLASRRHIVLLNCSQEATLVSLDPRRFQQILQNFIGNAIKFSPEQSLVLINGELSTKDKKNYAAISVTDQGVGIPADKMNSIFQKYQQLDNLEAVQALGVGLGLSIAQQFAKLHGATIEVTSQVGKGSTFTVWLPLERE